MNMIMSEQKQAWDVLKSLHKQNGVCIVSGVLAEQKKTISIRPNFGVGN